MWCSCVVAQAGVCAQTWRWAGSEVNTRGSVPCSFPNNPLPHLVVPRAVGKHTSEPHWLLITIYMHLNDFNKHVATPLGVVYASNMWCRVRMRITWLQFTLIVTEKRKWYVLSCEPNFFPSLPLVLIFLFVVYLCSPTSILFYHFPPPLWGVEHCKGMSA